MNMNSIVPMKSGGGGDIMGYSICNRLSGRIYPEEKKKGEGGIAR